MGRGLYHGILGFLPSWVPGAKVLMAPCPSALGPSEPLVGCGVWGCVPRGAKSLSTLLFPFFLKVDPLLRLEIPTTLPPWRVCPSFVVLFCEALVFPLVVIIGFGG